MADPLLIARHDTIECALLPSLANRHGLITGATGTGKTVTLQTIAEKLSSIGVPVFMADVKGDLTGMSQKGSIGEKMAATLKERGLDLPEPLACPVTLWDVFGEQGHPVRATVSDMGPLLLARMLDLNETQDRESAYEKLKGRADQEPAPSSSGGGGATDRASGSSMGGLGDILFGSTGPRGGKREGMVEAMAKSAVRTIGSSVGREIVRGVLGSLLGGKRR